MSVDQSEKGIIKREHHEIIVNPEFETPVHESKPLKSSAISSPIRSELLSQEEEI